MGASTPWGEGGVVNGSLKVDDADK